MSDPDFRLVAVVPSLRLGSVLANLQLAGCVVEACNVIVPQPVPKQDKPKAKAKRRGGPRPQTGVSARTRELLSAFRNGEIVRSAEVTRQLVDDGFLQSSASSVVTVGLKIGRRFAVVEPGVYRVVDETQPIQLYKTAAMVRAERETRK